MICTCGRIKVGFTVTENRNWNPECDEHGLDTTWYREYGRELFQAWSDKAVALQKAAREAKDNSRNVG